MYFEGFTLIRYVCMLFLGVSKYISQSLFIDIEFRAVTFIKLSVHLKSVTFFLYQIFIGFAFLFLYHFVWNSWCFLQYVLIISVWILKATSIKQFVKTVLYKNWLLKLFNLIWYDIIWHRVHTNCWCKLSLWLQAHVPLKFVDSATLFIYIYRTRVNTMVIKIIFLKMAGWVLCKWN